MADFDINRLPAKPTERVIKAKEMFLEENPEMCCQRAIIYTEVYRNLSGRCPTILLRAKALCRTLEELPIFIQPQEVIVGHSASRPRSAEVFPEVNINFTDEIDQFETRKYNRLRVRPEVRASLLEIAPFWKGNTPHDYLMRQRTAAIQNAYVCGLLSDPHEGSGFAHVAMNYQQLLQFGINGMLERVRKQRDTLNRSDPAYDGKLAFYDAEEEVCVGVLVFAERYRRLEKKMAAQEKDPCRKVELTAISRVLARVPAQPASSFHEALQMVWLMQLIPQIESNGFSISLGRLDQYCWPYLKADLAAGTITLEQAQELLALLWLKCCEILRVDSRDAAEVNAGYYVAGQNIEVGGVDRGGHDCTNLLSYLCLNANRHIQLHQPNFTVRLHAGTPQEFLNHAVGSIPLQEARDYIAVGCNEISVHGHWARCNGGYINLPKVLELTLGNGTDPKSGVSMFHPDDAEPKSFRQLMNRFYSYFQQGIALQVEETNITDGIHKELLPLPFVSLFWDDCVANGRDCTNGGAHYNTTGLVAVGTATVVDSLEAVRQLVYRGQRLTLNEFARILKDNFRDREPLRQFILNRIPKFGNDVDRVDILAVEITDMFANQLERFENSRGQFWPALYSVSAQVVWATPAEPRQMDVLQSNCYGRLRLRAASIGSSILWIIPCCWRRGRIRILTAVWWFGWPVRVSPSPFPNILPGIGDEGIV